MVGPLLRHLKLDLVETYFTPDGNFPGHEPNPLLPENRAVHHRQGRRARAPTSGIAWDGDADRCFFIDDTGAFVDGDFLTALLAESLLAKVPGSTILYDVRASLGACRDTVERLGGRALPNRVGHAFFKTRMREEDAIFGGEVSGHYYFRDFYCADSGTIPALLMLELLSTSGKRLSELLEPYRSTYFISGEINSEVDDAEAKMAEIAARVRGAGRRDRPPRRRQRRLRRLALQRAPLEHRAAAAPVPGVARVRGGHGAPARRGARADPLVSGEPRPRLRHRAGTRRATRARGASRRASTASRSRRRSPSGGSTST